MTAFSLVYSCHLPCCNMCLLSPVLSLRTSHSGSSFSTPLLLGSGRNTSTEKGKKQNQACFKSLSPACTNPHFHWNAFKEVRPWTYWVSHCCSASQVPAGLLYQESFVGTKKPISDMAAYRGKPCLNQPSSSFHSHLSFPRLWTKYSATQASPVQEKACGKTHE